MEAKIVHEKLRKFLIRLKHVLITIDRAGILILYHGYIASVSYSFRSCAPSRSRSISIPKTREVNGHRLVMPFKSLSNAGAMTIRRLCAFYN